MHHNSSIDSLSCFTKVVDAPRRTLNCRGYTWCRCGCTARVIQSVLMKWLGSWNDNCSSCHTKLWKWRIGLRKSFSEYETFTSCKFLLYVCTLCSCSKCPNGVDESVYRTAMFMKFQHSGALPMRTCLNIIAQLCPSATTLWICSINISVL